MKVLRIVSLLVFSVSMQAQSLQLSLEDAIKRSIQNSRALHISSEKVNQAEAKLSETDAGRLPSVKLTGSYNRLSDVGPAQFDNPFVPGSKIVLSDPILDNIQFNLAASQVIFAGFKLDAAKDIAAYGVKAAEYDYNNDVLSAAYNTSVTYWTFYKSLELKKSITETVKQLEARLRDGQNLFKAGMLTNNDLLKLQVQLANTKVQLLDVEQQSRSLMVVLNNQIGQPLTTVIELSTQPGVSLEAPSNIGPSIEKAQTDRPDVLATEYRVMAADKGITVANGGWYPQISANASYLLANPNTRIFPVRPQYDGTWALGLNLSWDVWNWMTPSHQAAQAKAQMLQAKEGLGQIKEGIAVEATQNYLALSPARQRIAVAEEAMQQAMENNNITSSRYKVGSSTGTEVIEAETLLLQSKVNKISAVVDYELAVAKLNRSLGK